MRSYAQLWALAQKNTQPRVSARDGAWLVNPSSQPNAELNTMGYIKSFAPASLDPHYAGFWIIAIYPARRRFPLRSRKRFYIIANSRL